MFLGVYFIPGVQQVPPQCARASLAYTIQLKVVLPGRPEVPEPLPLHSLSALFLVLGTVHFRSMTCNPKLTSKVGAQALLVQNLRLHCIAYHSNGVLGWSSCTEAPGSCRFVSHCVGCFRPFLKDYVAWSAARVLLALRCKGLSARVLCLVLLSLTR
jgi:hypothetical protein